MLNNAWVRTDVSTMVSSVDPKYTLEAAKHFSRFKKPVKLVWAEEDFLFKTSQAIKLAALFPNAKITHVKNSLFLVPVDRPDALAKAILEKDEEGFESIKKIYQ